MFSFAIVSILSVVADTRKINDYFELSACNKRCESSFAFNCNCEYEDWRDREITCISSKLLCDGVADCENEADEMDCICPKDKFQCSYCGKGGACSGHTVKQLYQCISLENYTEYDLPCYSRRDQFIKRNKCKPCDGYIDCPWLTHHDEENCTCPPMLPNRCDCNKENEMTCASLGWVCYKNESKCNRGADCVDSSDEVGCPCEDHQFTCQCYKNDPVSCFFDKACISNGSFHDGKVDCPDGSDETQFNNTVELPMCNVTIQRLNDTSHCTDANWLSCDNSTCYETPSIQCSTMMDCNISDVICSSCCVNHETKSCEPSFQCDDGSLILATQFCNGKIDCPDNSDEIRNQPGFKCFKSINACNLPQRNLYDDIAHCVVDERDLCNGNETTSCFQCYDKHLLISSKQVCDGVIDCYDLSDECLCEVNLDNPICKALFTHDNKKPSVCSAIVNKIDRNIYTNNPKLVNALNPDSNVDIAQFFNKVSDVLVCETKHGYTKATLCDDRPECRDFSDECACRNPPSFCNDTCRSHYDSFYPLGDLYCNGKKDILVWNYINESACPLGFDEIEKFCPKRFPCKSGDKISIDVSEVCNGIFNCDDKSDEDIHRCSETSDDHVFSSETEMISDIVLKSAFWIIGLVVIVGNLYVIVTKINFLKTTTNTASLQCQHLILLNISCADFIMGIYLLAIASYSAVFSGYYGLVDIDWRTSMRCSIIGSMAVISSEASCFFMVILTSFRLQRICRPFTSSTSPIWPWKVCIVSAWLISLTLAVVPIFHHTFHYFVHRIYFPIEFNKNELWKKESLITFACRLAAMTNKTINKADEERQWPRNFLEENFPKASPLKELGYYSSTSVCMPMFYVEKGDNAWGYCFTIIFINFLSFIFIAMGYISLFIESNKSYKKESIMQKRIARIIATDFFCWIPICILAFVKFNGVELPIIVYQISAVFLLPINSALNPFLYSSAPDKVIEKIVYWKKRLSCY